MGTHDIFAWVRDVGGIAVISGLIYQLGKLVNQLERLSDSMTGHINSDDTRFSAHASLISQHGERIAKLEGGAQA